MYKINGITGKFDLVGDSDKYQAVTNEEIAAELIDGIETVFALTSGNRYKPGSLRMEINFVPAYPTRQFNEIIVDGAGSTFEILQPTEPGDLIIYHYQKIV